MLGVEARELRLTGGGVSGRPVTLRFLEGITVRREEYEVSNGEKNRRTTEAVSKRGALGGEKGLGQTVRRIGGPQRGAQLTAGQ